MLELKELGERRPRGGGVSGMGTSRGLALPVTVGCISGYSGAPRGSARDMTLRPPMERSLY
jgi:hypothetical protein